MELTNWSVCWAELFDETYEVLDSISFFQQSVSPALWACFEATYLQFKSGTLDHLHGELPKI